MTVEPERHQGILTPAVEAVLGAGTRPAHLITLGVDGRPHVTLVWTGVEDGEIVVAHLSEHQKVRNMRRDARVAISVETGTRHPSGLDEYLVVEGIARITEGGAADLLQQLVRRYIGPEAIYPLPDPAPVGYVTRIAPSKIGGVGPWNP